MRVAARARVLGLTVMPKKKLAKKKVGGAKKSSSKVSDKAIDNAGPTPHEISLRLELESLEQELSVVKAEVEEVRKQVGHCAGLSRIYLCCMLLYVPSHWSLPLYCGIFL